MINLHCECQVTEEGKFIVSDRCQFCKECNTISKLHPFGEGRLSE
jgi:hypothetical protein